MDDALSAPDVTLEDVKEEGQRLATDAARIDLPLRIFGGVAFYLRCPSARLPNLSRTYGDVDFMALSSARAEVTDFFEAHGYAQDRMFNALHGAVRLNFTDPRLGRPVDVVVDELRMCHTIDFRERLTLEPLTVPLTDLMLTKLQVIELNDKDVRDLLALLSDHEVGDTEPGERICTGRLGDLLGDDWGFHHTVDRNLGRVAEAADGYGLPPATVVTIRDRIARLQDVLESTPKSLRWRMRAKVGERVRWYELPEEGRR